MSTPNYGLTLPTPGGSNGAWGDILNDAVTALDELLYPLIGKLSETTLLPLTPASAQSGWTGDGIVLAAASGASSCYVPIPHAKPGTRITGFSSRGVVSGAMAVTVSLRRVDFEGNFTVISAGHSVPSSLGTTTTSGLTHDVTTGGLYYLRLENSGIGACNVYGLSVDVEVTP